MSGPFAPGDVVVCLKSTWRSFCDNFAPSGAYPVQRGVYRVAKVGRYQCIDYLALDGIPNHWDASFFRHLPKADPAFTEAMRAIKPVRKTVKA